MTSDVSRELPVLYEDDDLIALNKPTGICSIPERNKSNDILSLLTEKWGQRPFVVHRLDRDVSGVILYAKNALAHQTLNEQFSSRMIKKTYRALVHGSVSHDRGTIDKPIRKFGSGRMGFDALRGKESQTDYAVLERFPRFTLVNVHPITGRRHQIRVHLFLLNHPIVGDTLYGDQRIQKPFPRLMLHAARIEFVLPSGQPLAIESSLPDSLRGVLDQVRLGQFNNVAPRNTPVPSPRNPTHPASTETGPGIG